MKYVLVQLATFFWLSVCFAQYENIWAFGNKAGLDFNAGVIPVSTAINSSEAGASVCDTDGNLLFYTDGESVWDRNHVMMANGVGLTAYGNGTLSTSQGAVIVAMPGSDYKYYVFSLSDNKTGGNLFYSVVDMQRNNGLGDVDPFVKAIPVDSFLTEHMAAITGDQCNIWLLAISRRDIDMWLRDSLMELKAFNIDFSGVTLNPVVSHVRAISATTWDGKWVGGIFASPDRKKIAIAGGGLWLYDFNIANGLVTNGWQMANRPKAATSPDWIDHMYFYSSCFSEDGTKLYGSTNRRVFQFDLSLGNYNAVVNSRVTVCDTTELIQFGSGMKRGPDGRIYVAHHGFPSLSVIQFPNRAGLLAGFVKDAIPLSGMSLVNLPNTFPAPVRDTLYSARFDTVDCFAADHPIHIDPSAVNVRWEDGSDAVRRQVNRTGKYWVSYNVPPCLNNRYIDTFQVFFRSIVPDIVRVEACVGVSNGRAWAVPAADDTNVYRYVWRDMQGISRSSTDTLSGVPAGSYSLEIVSNSGCRVTVPVEITEVTYHVSFAADTVVCQHAPAHFQNTSHSYYTSFQWYFGDGQSASVANGSNVYEHPGIYTVMLTGTGTLCSDTAYRHLIVDSLHPAAFITKRDSLCLGEELMLLPDTLLRETATSLQWKFGDGVESAGDYAADVRHVYTTPGVYPVSLDVRFRSCPAASVSDTVYVYALPEVYLAKEYIGPDSGLCLNGAVRTLKNEALTAAGQLYRWSTGAVSESIMVNTPGMYVLTVRNEPIGCAAADSVLVVQDCRVGIPNAFIPDGDGINDYFFPRLWQIGEVQAFNMKVFNRWGQKIFETNDPRHRGWDGTLQGHPQPGGVYVYTIRLLLRGQDAQYYQGNVTLLR